MYIYLSKLLRQTCLFICSIFILLSRESDGGAIFWMNSHPLRSCQFPSFPVVSLTSYHWICCCSKPPSRDNHRKASYPRMQQHDRRGWELNLDHAIVIFSHQDRVLMVHKKVWPWGPGSGDYKASKLKKK